MDFSNRFKVFCLGCYIFFSLTLGVTMLLTNRGDVDQATYFTMVESSSDLPADFENPHTLKLAFLAHE